MKNSLFLFAAVAAAVVLSGVRAYADEADDIEAFYSENSYVQYDNQFDTGYDPNGYPVITAILSQPGVYGGHTYTGWSVLAQDYTGSLNLFVSQAALTNLPGTPSNSTLTPPYGTPATSFAVGDGVNVAGQWSPFHSVPELAFTTAPASNNYIAITSTGNQLPGPTVFTINQVNTVASISNNPAVAGMYIELQDVTFSGSTGSFQSVFPNYAQANVTNETYTITDNTGSMTMFDDVTDYSACGALGGTAVPNGTVTAYGFLQVFPNSGLPGGGLPEFTMLSFSPSIFPAMNSWTDQTVSAAANIYGAGANPPPDPGGGGAGILPTGYTLPSNAAYVTFSNVTGTVNLQDESGDLYTNNPDGFGAAVSTSTNSGYSPISGIIAPNAGYLVGVFIGGPVPSNAPPRLNFIGGGTNNPGTTSFTSLSPQLYQTFFIGDGLTGNGTGSPQQFKVPAGATTLFLGISDALNYNGPPGYYGDNDGFFTIGSITITPVPTSNTWVSASSGKWETATNWSLGTPPSLSDLADYIGNANTKTVTVDAATVANAPSTLIISNLYVAGTANSTNTLFLNNVGTNTPLQVIGDLLALDINGALVVNNSAIIPSTNLLLFGELILGNTGGNTSLIITNGGVVDWMSAEAICYVGYNSSSSNNALVVTGTNSVLSVATLDFATNGGSQNSLTIANGGAVFSGSGGNPDILGGSTMAVVTGPGSVWNQGPEQLRIGDPTGGNALIITNGGAVTSALVELGTPPSGSNNMVLVTGTNSVWSSDNALFVGYSSASNTLTIANGGAVSATFVAISYFSSNNVIQVTGASLVVTNGGTGQLVVSREAGKGSLILSNGTVTVDQLVMTNGANSVMQFSAGTLISGGTFVTNGQVFVVGDGTDAATFVMNGGVHNFASNLEIRANGTLTGCGTVNGNVLVNSGGSIISTCATQTFTGIVTNNGTIIATNGATIIFDQPVVNYGAVYGPVQFLNGVSPNIPFVPFPNNGTHTNASVMAAIANVPTNVGVVFDANGQTNDIQIWNYGTGVYTGAVDVSSTLQRIRNGQSVASTESDDGGFFNPNSTEFPNIPRKGNNYYMEFMVWPYLNLTNNTYTTDVDAYGSMAYPGAMRLLIGLGGEVYFTGDHYGEDGPQQNAYYLVPSPSQAIGNSWTNAASGRWESKTNWSFTASAPSVAPSDCDPADLITNVGSKTVTLDAVTAAYQASLSVLSINNLIVSAPAGSVNTLLLTSGFTNALQIASSLSVLSGGSLTLAGGTLASSGTYVTNNQTFFVGDGTDAATFQMNDGIHSFANGLEIRNNATLTGCGTINGNVTVDAGGSIISTCATQTFSGIVTNNGTIIATNSTVINFNGPVVNNAGGVINGLNGTVNFAGGFQNNGTLLLPSATNSWISGASGKWETATNWSLGTPPSLSDLADYIGNAATKIVTIDAVTVLSNAGNRCMTISNLYIAGTANSANTLALTNAGTAVPLQVLGTALTLDTNSALIVNHSDIVATNPSAQLIVGNTGGNAALTITNGGGVYNSLALVGYASSSRNNTLLVTGSGSSWNNLDLHVGENGPGNSLIISNGAFVFSYSCQMGYATASSSNNTALVTGSGSVWTNISDMSVGSQGAGNVLTINSGGAVWNATGHIGGQLPSSNDTVTVTGTGSSWNNLSDLHVGENGANSLLTISNGGAVNNVNGYVGYNSSSSNNSVLVTGVGSTWNNGASLFVGDDGAGNTLTIANGGTVNSSGNGHVGTSSSSSSNSVLVTGTGSVWSFGGFLAVGDNGSSNALTITNGGQVFANNIYISAAYSNPGNRITISGGGLYANSALDTRSGTLTFNGGTVTVNQLVLTNGANSVITFNAGTLISGGTFVTNNQVFVVGDGTDAATFELNGGYHSFASNLVISDYATLTGCGTIEGNVTVDPGGTVLTTCGGSETLTFTGIVTNNGAIIATNGTIAFLQQVVNNGVISGSVQYLGGVCPATINTSSSPAGGGTTSGGGVITCGSNATVCATANAGYVFAYWTANSSVVSTSTCYMFTPDNNLNLVANFAPFHITRVVIESNNVLVTWIAPEGSTNVVQATDGGAKGSYSTNNFQPISPLIVIPGTNAAVGVTTNYLDVGGATNFPARYYRVGVGGMFTNLIVNGDFSSGNSGFSSGYTFVGSGTSTSPGTYGIRTNSQNFNPSYAIFGDHTTGTGNMMLVDGYSPSTVVWSETISVSTNTQYDFSAWATASDSANLPTLQFFVNGVQIGGNMTLSSNAGQWQEFSAVWNSASASSATIIIYDVNSLYENAGDDFALDDLSLVVLP